MLIRVEELADRRRVEEITRDAFWNLYIPGADEHYLIHVLRSRPEFIPELCLVAVDGDGQIVGNIAYTRSEVKDSSDGRTVLQTVTFGPVSVASDQQGKGVGASLIKESIKRATEMGFLAIVIKGYPCYYERFGFVNGQRFGISAEDGTYPKGLQVLELKPGALNGVKGVFSESEAFQPDPEEVAKFDKTFPEKPKLVTYSQKAFEQMIELTNDDPVPSEVYAWSHRREKIDDN